MTVRVSFEVESENGVDMQRDGWQAVPHRSCLPLSGAGKITLQRRPRGLLPVQRLNARENELGSEKPTR